MELKGFQQVAEHGGETRCARYGMKKGAVVAAPSHGSYSVAHAGSLNVQSVTETC